jgi:vacuolar protein sorting-associated protein 13B
VFYDVNLNLEALEAELRLPPITFVSGHIHELRLSVPWTKITSEPIRVYVNTFEIVLKLRGKHNCDVLPKRSPTSAER